MGFELIAAPYHKRQVLDKKLFGEGSTAGVSADGRE
jgi:hypothetical protein